MNILKTITSKLKASLKEDILFPENKELLDRFGSYSKAYILGSSPTIGKLNLKHIEDDVLIISMGNFHEHPDIDDIGPHIHMFAASHEPLTDSVMTNWWMRCNDILPKTTLILHEKRDKFVGEKAFPDRKRYQYSYGGTFPSDFTKKVVTPWSVTQVAIQLCLYINIKETYLLGVTHDWQSCKPYEHFFKSSKPSLEYYMHKEGIKTRNEQLKQPMPKEKMYRSYELYQGYEQLKIQAEQLNLKIYNGDSFSSFDVFEKQALLNLIHD
ncbi:MAG: hypothetical protein AAFX55_20585 [Bacteroidota bacterium]